MTERLQEMVERLERENKELQGAVDLQLREQISLLAGRVTELALALGEIVRDHDQWDFVTSASWTRARELLEDLRPMLDMTLEHEGDEEGGEHE